MAIKDWSATPASNTSISGINIAEGCPPSGINDAIRQLMADLRAADFGTSAPKTDTIAESTAAAGVTIDGLLIKDGAIPGLGAAVKVSSDDTTFGYLDGKLALASNSALVLAVTSPGGNEVLTVKADYGTTANKLVRLDASAKLPAVDGSHLTNLPGGTGYKTIFVGGGAMTPSQTAGATPAIIEDGTNDLTRPCMMFKGVTADTSAEWCHPMPEDWDRSTVKAKVLWSAQTGASASDTVRFSLAAGAFSDDDPLDSALGTAVTMDDTVTAAGDMQTTPASAALTVGGTPALGDLIRWKITRDFDYGAQPMTEDAAVIGVWIQYQATNTPAAW